MEAAEDIDGGVTDDQFQHDTSEVVGDGGIENIQTNVPHPVQGQRVQFMREDSHDIITAKVIGRAGKATSRNS